MKKQKILLIDDVYGLGKKGEIAQAKPGYFRNFLFPNQKAVRADKNTLRMQEKLKKEREEKAKQDREESLVLAKKIAEISLEIEVKTDPEGKMYGSVSASDIVQLLQEKGVTLDKRSVRIEKPLKSLGTHKVLLILKEEVEARVSLKIDPEEEAVKLALEKKAAEFAEKAKLAEQEEPSADESE